MNRTRPWITTFLPVFLALGLPVRHTYGQAIRPDGRSATHDAIVIQLPLSLKSNGIDGYLELRQDPRLTPRLTALLWGFGGVNIDDDARLALFKSEPPRDAMIQVVDRTGTVLQAESLERPLAKLRTVQLYGDSRLTYLLTVDYSAGFGSYSGPITRLVEIKNGRLRRVEATDGKTGESGEISLMESLKTTWKFVDSPSGKGKQILLAQCRPNWASDKDDPDFTTTLARFYFDGAKWLVAKRTVKGLSDFDQGFPNRKNFP